MKKILTIAAALLATMTMTSKAEDVVLYSADYTTYEAIKLDGKTENKDLSADLASGERVYTKKGYVTEISTDGLSFGGQNAAKNHCIAIPVTGVNGKITITITDAYDAGKSSYKYGIVNGKEINNSSISFNSTTRQAKNEDVTASTEVEVAVENCVVFIGEASSSFPLIKKIEITTPKAEAVSDPVSKVTVEGPTECYIGQKVSFTATPDVKANSIFWTVDGAIAEGATDLVFDFTPEAERTYSIAAWARNDNNAAEEFISGSINLVASVKPILEQVAVSENTTWDWTKAASVKEIEFTDATTPQKNKDTVLLANIDGMNNDAEFNSQALLFMGQFAVRDGKYCQTKLLSFKTTVAGTIVVEFSNTGSDTRPDRVLLVNDVETSFKSNTSAEHVTTDKIAVEAGEVVIEALEMKDEPAKNLIRIFKVVFEKGTATAIDNTEAEVKAVKVIRNGQLFIEKNGVLYNAQGVVVE